MELSRRRLVRRGALCGVLMGFFASGIARATLTDSEKAQVAGFVTEGVAAKAARARSLVARPDLTAAEVAEPLVRGYEASPFDEQRLRFTEALLFGPGSAPARNTLAPAVVSGLVARASRRMEDIPRNARAPRSRRAGDAAAEVADIFRFIDERIANAGRPPPDGHDAAVGIRDDALRACADHVREHLTRHAAWREAPLRSVPELRRLYLQEALTLVDLGRGLVERHVMADWLGFEGASRAAFERHGLVFEVDGDSSERNDAALAIVERNPRALSSVSLLLVSKLPAGGLSARGETVSAGTTLRSNPDSIASARLWPDDIAPSRPDPQLSRVALAVAQLSAKRALGVGSGLRDRAALAVRHAEAAGGDACLGHDLAVSGLVAETTTTPALRGLSPELLLTHSVRMLLVDAPRALDLALIRAAGGRPEPLEQLVLAMSALGAPGRDTIGLGRVGDHGSIEPIAATKVAYQDGSIVAGFTLLDHRYDIGHDSLGQIAATRDGKVPTIHELPSFQVNPRRAEFWNAPGGRRVERLFGQPAATSVGDGRFVLEGSSAGFDAVSLGADGPSNHISAWVLPHASGGGPIVGASAGETSYVGVALLLSEQPRQAQLVAVDGKGKAWQLAEPLQLAKPGAEGYAVDLSLSEGRVQATVEGKNLNAVAPDAMVAGKAGFTVRAGGRLDLRRLALDPAGKP